MLLMSHGVMGVFEVQQSIRSVMTRNGEEVGNIADTLQALSDSVWCCAVWFDVE